MDQAEARKFQCPEHMNVRGVGADTYSLAQLLTPSRIFLLDTSGHFKLEHITINNLS
jgi:hypothetical protein